jgi:hypothetical protein
VSITGPSSVGFTPFSLEINLCLAPIVHGFVSKEKENPLWSMWQVLSFTYFFLVYLPQCNALD